MKLLLTSAGWEKNLEIGKEFLKLVNKKTKEVGVFCIITPSKFIQRGKEILKQFKRLQGGGIPAENITFFKLDRKVTENDLKGIDVIFVFGGNTFDYLNRIKKTGLDKFAIHQKAIDWRTLWIIQRIFRAKRFLSKRNGRKKI